MIDSMVNFNKPYNEIELDELVEGVRSYLYDKLDSDSQEAAIRKIEKISLFVWLLIERAIIQLRVQY
jgi:hypothetical protein